MFTPQEIQEQTFSKAVFGGYDMQQVDDFLEPLTDDYITLYKENSVLKAKMKILVEKLEEYRAQETKQSTAAADAEAKSAQLLKETQARCAAMLQNAEVNAQTNAQVNAANVQLAQLNQQLHAEQERLDYAKQTALNFISVVERDIQGHLELLETLKARDLTREAAPAQPQPAHEKPYDWQAEQPAAPAPAPSEDAEKIATEISDNLEKLIGSDSGAETKTASAPALSKQAHAPCTPKARRSNLKISNLAAITTRHHRSKPCKTPPPAVGEFSILRCAVPPAARSGAALRPCGGDRHARSAFPRTAPPALLLLRPASAFLRAGAS